MIEGFRNLHILLSFYALSRWYRSMVDPKSDTQYTCRILDNGREPKVKIGRTLLLAHDVIAIMSDPSNLTYLQFEVTADDCPMTYSGPTPTTVWTIIVR